MAIPGAVFNSQIQDILTKRVSDPGVQRILGSGSAYSHVSSSYVRTLPADVRDYAVSVHVDVLRILDYLSLELESKPASLSQGTGTTENLAEYT